MPETTQWPSRKKVETRNSGTRPVVKTAERKHSYQPGDTYPVPVGKQITNDFLRDLAKELKQNVCTVVSGQKRGDGWYVDVPQADGTVASVKLDADEQSFRSPLRYLICEPNGTFRVSSNYDGVIIRTKK